MVRLPLLAMLLVLAVSADAADNAIETPLSKLLRHPEQFNGKRVAFVAYWDSDGHATSLRVGLAADAPRIYCDFAKPRIPVKLIESIPRGAWVRVVGVFRYVDMTVHARRNGSRVIAAGFGWMNSYDREVTDITEFTRVRHQRI
jgi:hypothetical protein